MRVPVSANKIWIKTKLIVSREESVKQITVEMEAMAASEATVVTEAKEDPKEMVAREVTVALEAMAAMAATADKEAREEQLDMAVSADMTDSLDTMDDKHVENTHDSFLHF